MIKDFHKTIVYIIFLSKKLITITYKSLHKFIF